MRMVIRRRRAGETKIKQTAQNFLYNAAMFMELMIGLLIVAALLISALGLLYGLNDLYAERLSDYAFREFLAGAFNVVIGVEFLKMLCRHTLSSVIEVLLFAIARGMVAEHTTPLENLLSIAAIAILFIVRKYLFIPGLDDNRGQDEHI